ncbi:MAG: YdbH domain-containing protein [Thermodesulfobacteriota bacterium]
MNLGFLRISPKTPAVAAGILLAFGFAFFCAAFLPALAERLILARLNAEAPLEISFRLGRISPFRLSLQAMRIGPVEGPAVTAAAVTVGYRWQGLFRLRLTEVVVDAPVVHLQTGATGVRLRGVAAGSGGSPPAAPTIPEFASLACTNGTLVFHGNGTDERLHFDGAVQTAGRENLKGGFTVRFREQEVRLRLDTDADLREIVVGVNGDFHLDRVGDLMHRFGYAAAGRLRLTGGARLSLRPLGIRAVDLHGQGDDLFLGTTAAAITGSALLAITSDDGGLYRLAVDSLSFAGSADGRLQNVECSLRLDGTAGVAGQAKADLSVHGLALDDNLQLTTEMAATLTGDFSGGVDAYSWSAALRAAGDWQGAADGGETTFSVGRPQADCEGVGGAGQGKIACRGEGLLAVAGGSSRIELTRAAVQLDTVYDREGFTWQLQSAGMLAAAATRGTATARWQAEGRGGLGPSVYTIALADGTVASGEFRGEGVRGELSWPMGQGAAGSLAVAGLKKGKRKLGSLRLALAGGEKQVSVSGRLSTTVADGLTLAISGEIPMVDGMPVNAALRFAATEHSFATLDGGRPPLLGGLDGSGRVDARGSAAIDSCGTKMTFAVSIRDGKLGYPEKKLAVEGLAGGIVLQALPELRSEPAEFTFSGLHFGDYRFTGGRALIRLDSAERILVEDGEVGWCSGTVGLHGIRIDTAAGSVRAGLSCNRLNLAQLLTQLGVGQVTGDGTVSGRIPFEIDRGRVRFGEGYLQSSPDGGGSIRLETGTLLTSGLVPGTPQFLQLDFAGEALRDFRYDWAKLQLHSEGKEAVLALTIHGRPARPLPFRYDGGTGTFRRLSVAGSGGIDQPIRLDVNFRIPFDELLGYGTTIRKVLDLNRP